jgi:hypothetical protein
LKIRNLAHKGVEQFRKYLDELRQGSQNPPPYSLLENPEFSAPLKGDAGIEQRTFGTRLQLAQYLAEVLDGAENDGLENDVGLWSWLSLFYFDQVCPAEENGLRKPGRDYRHILEPGYPNGHRHLLAGAWLVYSVYGLGDELSRLLLWTPLHLESKFHNQLAARQTLITNKSILDAADKMYFFESENRPKRGALIEKNSPGTLLRFIDVIQQLDLTYDLYSMSGEEILALLPPEFDRWKTKP